MGAQSPRLWTAVRVGVKASDAAIVCHIPAPVSRSYFIPPFGCQMNESDSLAGRGAGEAGWVPTAAPTGPIWCW